MNEKIKLTVVFGEDATRKHLDGEKDRSVLENYGTITDYEFDTQAEADAFLKGVYEAIGWMEFTCWEED